MNSGMVVTNEWGHRKSLFQERTFATCCDLMVSGIFGLLIYLGGTALKLPVNTIVFLVAIGSHLGTRSLFLYFQGKGTSPWWLSWLG